MGSGYKTQEVQVAYKLLRVCRFKNAPGNYINSFELSACHLSVCFFPKVRQEFCWLIEAQKSKYALFVKNMLSRNQIVTPVKGNRSFIRRDKASSVLQPGGIGCQRILKCFPPGINENIQADLQVKFTELIIRVLIANEGLHYYQGFHDIAITLLLVLGEDKSYSVLCRLSQSHFQLFMGPDMEPIYNGNS
ncbi:uncharacterized protein LOC124208952 [Daphnia pulex]|uniref:uncharacterized protein LOC124208952 n=1 Tax=Daphnia pulex TaxID=6669 RepID=UPI001EDD2BE6|nr:uncharacterized protein LOC124208952 [Daphnia pulex]